MVVAMKKRMVTSGTARLAVSEWTGGKPSVVGLHPGVADRRIWQWCAPEWAGAGFGVVTYDRRGFGKTQYIAEPHDDLADLRAVTEATDSRPAVFVGNSKGGGVALDLALAFPQEVTALCLIAPSPSGYDYDDWPTIQAEADMDELVAAADASNDLDLVNRLEAHYWLDGVEQPEGRVGGEPRDLMLEMNGQALRAEPIGETADHPPAWDRIEEIGVPALVVVGEHDLPGIRRQCDELTQRLPHATLALIEGSAHCPQLDQPNQLNSLVLDFLRSIDV